MDWLASEEGFKAAIEVEEARMQLLS